jgi:RNA repair, ligase-Pnkp-associating, region of Hen1
MQFVVSTAAPAAATAPTKAEMPTARRCGIVLAAINDVVGAHALGLCLQFRSFGVFAAVFGGAENCGSLPDDPVGLLRNRRGPSGEGGALEQYVNDRPYAASSFLSVAIAEVFGSALSGKARNVRNLWTHRFHCA